MFSGDHDCEAELILDSVSGEYICCRCGKIISRYYVHEKVILPERRTKFSEEIKDILDKMNISVKYEPHISQYHEKHFKTVKITAILFSIYKVLNETFNMNISIHVLSNISGCAKDKILAYQKMNENVFLDIEEMVERYCKYIDLSFTDASLIKERIKLKTLTGHTPSTVIATNIYKYCKENNKKISIKKVSIATSVSPISIQRYLKVIK